MGQTGNNVVRVPVDDCFEGIASSYCLEAEDGHDGNRDDLYRSFSFSVDKNQTKAATRLHCPVLPLTFCCLLNPALLLSRRLVDFAWRFWRDCLSVCLSARLQFMKVL
jgi:hypothetical protein